MIIFFKRIYSCWLRFVLLRAPWLFDSGVPRLGGGFSNFLKTPILGGRFPIWRLRMFFRWVGKLTTNQKSWLFPFRKGDAAWFPSHQKKPSLCWFPIIFVKKDKRNSSRTRGLGGMEDVQIPMKVSIANRRIFPRNAAGVDETTDKLCQNKGMDGGQAKKSFGRIQRFVVVLLMVQKSG